MNPTLCDAIIDGPDYYGTCTQRSLGSLCDVTCDYGYSGVAVSYRCSTGGWVATPNIQCTGKNKLFLVVVLFLYYVYLVVVLLQFFILFFF